MKLRKPWLAFLFSFVCPGLGQLYNGNYRLAIASLPIGAIISLLSAVYLADSFSKLLVALGLGFAYDLFFVEQARREARRKGEVKLGRYQAWWAYALYAVLLYGLPDGYGLFMPERLLSFQIPSESMVPNLLVGDRLVADGWAYWKQEPQRGDVVVFKYPKDESLVFVKRLVGLPGDKVEVRNRVLYVNGKEQKQEELPVDEALEQIDRLYRFSEQLGDVRHIIQRAGPGTSFSALANYGPITVPKDEFFMMGDNRDRSSDSRVWGFVKREAILGRMSFVYFSWDSERRRLRTDRVGLKVE